MDTTASDFGNVYLVIDTEDISFSVDQIETNLLVLYAGTDMEPKCFAFLKSLNSKFKSKSSIPRKDLTTFLYSSRFVESLLDEICYSQLTNDLINSTEGHVMYTDQEWVIEFNQEKDLEEDMPYVLEYLEELHLEKKIRKMTKYGFMRYTSNMLAKRIQNESTKQEKEIDKVKLEQLKKIQLEINAYNQEHKERIEEMKREEKKMHTKSKSEPEDSSENAENGKLNEENMESESSILEIKSGINEQKDKNKNNYNILEHSEFIAQNQEKVNNILAQSEFIAQNKESKIKVLEHSINKINKNMEDKFIKGLEKDIIRYSDIPNLKEKWKQYRELRKKSDILSSQEWEMYHEIENWIIWTIEIIDKLENAYCTGNKTALRQLWKKHEEWLVNETGLHPRLTKYLQMMNWTYNNG
jgi:hypothetical protein